MSLFHLHHKIFDKILKGLSLEYLEKHVEAFIASTLSSYLYMPAVNHLRLAQHLGHYTLILSNSPSFIVRAAASFLGVHEWQATEYTVDKDKNLSGISSIMQGENKADTVAEVSQRLQIQKQSVTAYSDSYLDLPFLLSAGTPVAVNPDRKLRSYSLAHNWTVI